MSKPFRILHVFPSFEVGGAQRRVVSLINAKTGNFTHSVYAMDGNYDALKLIRDIGEAPELPGAFEKMNPAKSALSCRQLLKDIRPDLMVTYNWGSVEWVFANRFLPLCPMIHVQDGFGAEEHDGELPRRRLARSLAYRGCDAVVVPSKTLERVALKRWRINRSKLHYIPNGIDIERFICPPDTALINQLGLTGQDRIIGTVAALRPEKNLGRLVEAFNNVAEAYRDTKLVIVGDGMARPALQMLADRIGLGSRVIFAGAQEKPERILPAFEIFALSSDTEQMPLSVIEAMACGLPVASTDVGDIRNMVAEENSDYISGGGARDLTRSLSALLDQRQASQKIGALNQAKAKREFDLRTMVERYENLFTAVIGKKGKP